MDEIFIIVPLTDEPFIDVTFIDDSFIGELSIDGTFVAMLPIEYGLVPANPEKPDSARAPRFTEDPLCEAWAYAPEMSRQAAMASAAMSFLENMTVPLLL
ncbi:MAG TPA: hypothetical protein VN455_10755 [Methanotrichaceae archaeon]|nr:hypothetical protein [Methanotrichaceae archaeon]